jgi:hypothetical protein
VGTRRNILLLVAERAKTHVSGFNNAIKVAPSLSVATFAKNYVDQSLRRYVFEKELGSDVTWRECLNRRE